VSIFVWTLGDVIGLLVVGIVAILFALIFIADRVKQLLCKHDGGYGETMACDAICRKCGKNLGFIGNFRGRP
jgi:hypothetical protein